MESNDACMSNDAALTICGRGFCLSYVTCGSDQEQDMSYYVVDQTPVLVPICKTDLTHC